MKKIVEEVCKHHHNIVKRKKKIGKHTRLLPEASVRKFRFLKINIPAIHPSCSLNLRGNVTTLWNGQLLLPDG